MYARAQSRTQSLAATLKTSALSSSAPKTPLEQSCKQKIKKRRKNEDSDEVVQVMSKHIRPNKNTKRLLPNLLV